MIRLERVIPPDMDVGLEPITLSDETIKIRKENVLRRMAEDDYDVLVIYADLEHGSQFEYLTGFRPRFEEALLILYRDGYGELVLGNENLNKASKSRIACAAVHMPCFSLPDQPDYGVDDIFSVLQKTRLQTSKKIGLVGWKLFSKKLRNAKKLYDLPYYIVEALKEFCTHSIFENATYIFIGENGVRTVNNAEELAHYEFGAALAGNCMLEAMNDLQEGRLEMEVATKLSKYGQDHNVVTIMAAGERFVKANMYPGTKKIQLGDRISLTTGYKGGLQSRGGYAVHNREEIPETERDYLEVVAIPYYNAVKTWLETIHIGMSGGELYRRIENAFPSKVYGWELNPGHLCADEEWLSSPVYEDSAEQLQSGMLLQIDIIPSVKGYGGISCESGIILADERLRNEIFEKFPEMWTRIQKRRDYLIGILGIEISEEVLPTSALTAYCRPFLLDKERAFIVARK